MEPVPVKKRKLVITEVARQQFLPNDEIQLIPIEGALAKILTQRDGKYVAETCCIKGIYCRFIVKR
jgi:hypothetical protein